MQSKHWFSDVLTKARSLSFSCRDLETQFPWSHSHLDMAAAASEAPSQPAVANPTVTQPFPSPVLPQELVEIVYSWALASGTTSVLRLSRRSNEIATRFRFKASIFRIKVQENSYGFNIGAQELSLQTAFSIQNVEVRIDLDCIPWPARHGSPFDVLNDYPPKLQAYSSIHPPPSRPVPGPLVHFMDPLIQRDTCYITIRSHNPQAHYLKPEYILSQIQRLKGFKTVIVRAIAGDGHHVTNDAVRAPRPTNPVLTGIREKLMCEMVRGELEEVFGPGVMHKRDYQKRYLEFHPM